MRSHPDSHAWWLMETYCAGTAVAAAERPEHGRQPKRRKDKGTPTSSAAAACSLPQLAHAALDAVLCTLAACADAMRLGVGLPTNDGAAEEEQEGSAGCQLAVNLLTWLKQLPEQALLGTLPPLQTSSADLDVYVTTQLVRPSVVGSCAIYYRGAGNSKPAPVLPLAMQRLPDALCETDACVWRVDRII